MKQGYKQSGRYEELDDQKKEMFDAAVEFSNGDAMVRWYRQIAKNALTTEAQCQIIDELKRDIEERCCAILVSLLCCGWKRQHGHSPIWSRGWH